jgi:hypothetical protein
MGLFSKTMAEPDSNHLYLAGDFQFFQDKCLSYLVRVHNKNSTVTGNQAILQQEKVSIYPNPLSEKLNILGWQPGLQLVIYTVEGKVLFDGRVEPENHLSDFSLPRGLFFWKAHINGQPKGGGKLVRY